jgi:hypothetical protein
VRIAGDERVGSGVTREVDEVLVVPPEGSALLVPRD